MAQYDIYNENADEKIQRVIEEYVAKFFDDNTEDVVRIRHNIWSVKEPGYQFNIVITSLLVIFDAVLFDHLPEQKFQFFEELLSLNAHHAKSSKLCLVKDTIHLRIIRGLEDFDYSEFAEHVEEYRQIFWEIKEKLIDKYYPENE